MKISSLLLAAGFTLFVPRAAAASETVPADTACTPALAADAPTPYIIMCSIPMRNRQVIDSLLADAARREMPVVNGPMRSELEQPAAAATAWQPETAPTEAVPSGPADRYHLLQTAYMGVPLIAGGLLMQGADHHVRNMRYQYAANFHTSVDAYTQYLPAAVMLGLKAGGVESRSQWGRMLVSDAFSAAIMAVAVNTIKLTADVQRPDGSAYNSFPSGHTATAFMTATMLSREYGHKSPWVSYGSYGLATATGLMRILNNRHWISDVMAGAAIGYISTQLGYFLTDLIFKDKYLNVKDEADLFDARRDPSFLGISLSYDLPGVSTRMNNGHRLRTASGVDLALEGAKFINPYLGFGGRASLSDLTVMVNNQTSPNSLGMVGLYAGVFGSYPLSARWSVGGKFLPGYARYPQTTVNDFRLGNCGGFGLNTGGHIGFMVHPHYQMKLFLDYDLRPSYVSTTRHCVHTLAIGGSANIAF